MMRFIIITLLLLSLIAGVSAAAGSTISDNSNKHNFSSSNTAAKFRATEADPRGRQICVFCHTPHRSSAEGPLWNRKATTVSFFNRYSSPNLAIDAISASEYGQPSGSSRLCLSCHDGVTALGAVFTTPGNTPSVDIPFTTNTLGYQTYSSHHPVSFKYDTVVRNALNAINTGEFIYINSSEVKLDKDTRMQCTTCHDPHQDKSTTPDPTTPFWVTTDYDKVCSSCHNIDPGKW